MPPNSDIAAAGQRPVWQKILQWSRRVGLGKRLAFALSLAALAAGFATYAAMTESAPFGQANPRTVTLLLTLDLAILLTLGVLIARRIVAILIGRRRGLAGRGFTPVWFWSSACWRWRRPSS